MSLKMNAGFYLLYLNRLCENDSINHQQYLYIYTIHEKMNACSILNIYIVCVKMHTAFIFYVYTVCVKIIALVHHLLSYIYIFHTRNTQKV